MSLVFPEGRRFAFTIMDDTDVATIENVAPVYQMLEDLGFRTTKTVWPFDYTEGPSNFSESETLENDAYLAFIHDLKRRGFEIAYHGPTMESSRRERIERGMARFKELFGGPPRVYANHSYNQENIYWGLDRIDDPILRSIYARTEGHPRGFYQGHVPGSAWWWGDLAREITYVRNLTFANMNVRRTNPSMPYRDASRDLVQWWFSAADAEDVDEFNRLVAPAAQDQLEAEGGVCIVATHLGKRFAPGGKVNPETRRLLERLAAKRGWFVPAGELLDWLRAQRRGASELPPGEWRRMQWRWAWDLLMRRFRRS